MARTSQPVMLAIRARRPKNTGSQAWARSRSRRSGESGAFLFAESSPSRKSDRKTVVLQTRMSGPSILLPGPFLRGRFALRKEGLRRLSLLPAIRTARRLITRHTPALSPPVKAGPHELQTSDSYHRGRSRVVVERFFTHGETTVRWVRFPAVGGSALHRRWQLTHCCAAVEGLWSSFHS